MTDQGNDPTRVDLPAAGPQDAPTQVVPPIDAGPPTQVGVPPTPPPGPPPDRWEGEGGPPDRRPWILAGVLGLIAVVAILLLVLGGDDDEDGEAATTTTSESTTTDATTTSESTTTTAAPTTTAPTTTTASPSVTVDPVDCREAGGDPLDPEAAAQTVYEAWTRDDEACARELMTDDAFEELFARDGTDADDQFQGCTEDADPEPYMDCAFTYEGGATHYRLVYSPTDGWQVQDVTQVAD